MKKPKTRYSLPRLLQTSPNESGAVSLGIALACFGKHLSIAQLRQLCGTNQSGTTTKKILSAIHRCGLNGDWVSLGKDTPSSSHSLSQHKFPAIIDKGSGKFEVLIEVNGSSALIYSPTVGLTYSSIDNLYIDSILGLSAGPKFVPTGSPLSIWNILYSITGKLKIELSLLVILSVVAVIPVLLIAACSSQFIDQFLENKYYSFAIPILWIAGISFMVSVSIRLLNDLIIRRITFVLMRFFSVNIYQFTLTKELAYFLERPSGSITYRMMTSYHLTYSLTFQLLNPILSLVVGLLIVLLSAFISLPLFFVLLLGTFVNICSDYLATMASSNELSSKQRESSEVTSSLYSILQYAEEFKTISAEFAATKQWQIHFYNLINIQQSIFLKNNIRNTSSNASAFLTDVLVLGIGGILIIQGSLTLGTLLAFLFIQSQTANSLAAIPSISSAWQQLTVLLMNYTDLEQAKVDTSIDIFERSPIDNKIKGDIEANQSQLQLVDVAYSISELDSPVFSGLNFSTTPGQHLLIKPSYQEGYQELGTNLFLLISGLLQPSSGAIRLNGVDINRYPTHILRKKISYVGQSIPFFDDSIQNNITLKRSFVQIQLLDRICETVGLDEFVSRRKSGYQSRLINSSEYLSLSEKFQFSVARALITMPSILILDFDVSQISPSNESSIYNYCRDQSITLISSSCRPLHHSNLSLDVSVQDLLGVA